MRNDLRAGIEHIDYFKTIPWCCKIIDNPLYTTSPTNSRLPKPSTTEDSFFAETLQTGRTIRKCLTLNTLPQTTDNTELPIHSVLTFFELGNGVNGFPNIAHGGFVATLLDELMGILLSVNQEYNHRERGEKLEMDYMTAYLNMKYSAPLRTPGVVLGRAWVDKVESRKIWIRAVLEDEEGKGLTSAECLFVKARVNPRGML
jgi:thioesterase superfamily protein 4